MKKCKKDHLFLGKSVEKMGIGCLPGLQVSNFFHKKIVSKVC